MRIATSSVRSIRKRLPAILRWLAERKPDIVALQKISVSEASFPTGALERAGYYSAAFGPTDRTDFGVAVLSRWELSKPEVWEAIKAAVKEGFKNEGMRCDPPSATDPERIKRTFGLSRKQVPNWHGLYYPLGGTEDNQDLRPAPSLGIQIDGGRAFFIGIRCLREDSEGLTAVKGAYAATQEAVSDSLFADFERDNDPWWPCWRYVLPDSQSFTFEHAVKLETLEAQKALAQGIAKELRKLWTTLKDHSKTRHLF